MSTSRSRSAIIISTNEELYELYRILDIRRKLADGQAYLEEARVMRGPPRGNFPPGTRSRIVRIKLAINDWVLCYAHQYTSASGMGITGPDPKAIMVDEVTFRQGSPS